MIGVKSIIFERDNQSLIIKIEDESKILYQDISKIVNNKVIDKYLESLFKIISDWKMEYINTQVMGGSYWKLDIIYLDGETKEYYGRSEFPNNFEALERLNQKLIEEAQYEFGYRY